MVYLSADAVRDVVERVVRTFIAAFVALYAPVVLGADSLRDLIDLSVADKALTAAIAAVLTLILSLLGTQLGNPDNASITGK